MPYGKKSKLVEKATKVKQRINGKLRKSIR